MPATESTPSTGPSDPVLAEVAQEFGRENEEVLFPLLDRITEMAAALAEGRPVDPDYLEGAVRLWAEYTRDLHQARLSRLEEIIRFAPTVVATAHARRHRLQLRRHRFGEHVVADDPLTAVYKEIRGTQPRMTERIAVLEGLITAYRRGDYFANQTLASILRSGAYSDRAWAKFEEEFVVKSLGEHLDPEEDLRLHREVADSGTVRSRVGREVQEFLARPLQIRSVGS